MVRRALRFQLKQLRHFSTLVRQVRMPCMKTLHKNNPTLYNALMYGSLYTLAEISQQTIKKYRTTTLAGNQLTHQPIVDLSSIGRFAVMGTAIMGPMFSRWYSWIDKTFPSKAKSVVLKKTLIDQFVFTPVCVVVFYVGMATMEGCRGAKLFEELKEKGPQTFAMDCCFWIPCTATNFFLIPAWFRVTFVALASFVWVNVLCWIKSWPREESAPVKKTSKPEVTTSNLNIIN